MNYTHNNSLKSEDVETWKLFMECSVKFLGLYQSILDAYILDFFQQDLWSLFPRSWHSVLDEISLSEISNFMNCQQKLRLQVVYPLSLLAFRATTFAYSIPRNQSIKIADLSSADLLERVEASDIEPIFRAHLKPKKQHEISRLAMLIARLYEGCNAMEKCVMVDIGSGRGHLSRLLAYGYGLPLACLEANEDLISSAKNLDNRLEVSFRKFLSKGKAKAIYQSPRHCVFFLSRDDDSEDIEKTLKIVWPEYTVNGLTNYGLIGLHACGDLAPIMLHNFVTSSSCQMVVSVSCCYMKLMGRHSIQNDGTLARDSNSLGYPMSEYLTSIDHDLSYSALEVSCHAIDAYAKRLIEQDDTPLKIHCYRATLEVILVRADPDLRHSGLRSVTRGHQLPFADYARLAVVKLPRFQLPEEDLHSLETTINLEQWKRVVIFFSLRLMMAPVVESLVLLDRLMFLHEKGFQGNLIPIFDPLISPRNQVLIAVKSPKP